MGIEEIRDQLSPDPASSATNQPKKPPQAPPLITIPYRTTLAFVLDGLGLPQAEYSGKIYDDDKVCVTILFHTSVTGVGDKDSRMIIQGLHSMDEAMSEHTAAMEAIRYLEYAVMTEVGRLQLQPKEEIES